MLLGIASEGRAETAHKDIWPPNWPSHLYHDLRQVALSVQITGDVPLSIESQEQVAAQASDLLDDQLSLFSVESVQYADLFERTGPFVDPSVLIIFCKVHLRSWEFEGSRSSILLGGVNLIFRRGDKTWSDESLRAELFAVQSTGDNVQSTVSSAVNSHLRNGVISPLSVLTKK